MSSDSSRRIQVPDELKEVLLQFSIAYLVEQPPDLIDFAADYFNKLQANRPIIASTDNGADDSQSINSQDGDGKSREKRTEVYLSCSFSISMMLVYR